MKLTEHDFFQFARRYFVKNAFDGALTILGVVMGSFISGVSNPKIIILIGFSTCIGMGVSGVWGTFLTESAERKRKLMELEKAMLVKLDSTLLGKSNMKKSIVLGLIDGFSPFLAALLALIPFISASLGFIDVQQAYYLSFIVIGMSLMGLGVILGMISKSNLLKSAVIMLFAGVTAALINTVFFVFT